MMPLQSLPIKTELLQNIANTQGWMDGTVNICITVLTKGVLWKAKVYKVKVTADTYLIACRPFCEECSYGDRLSSL